MLILLGSDKNSLESPIAKRFGHANYYLLYNTENKNLEAFENIDGGHNHNNFQNFLDKGVKAFIVGNIGPNAFNIINTPKSKVYLARKMSVQEAIEKYQKRELLQLTKPTTEKSIGHRNHEDYS